MTAGFVSLGAGPAWACSCIAATPAEYAELADVVFTGTVTDVIPSGIGTRHRAITARMTVHTVYKGEAPGEVSVVTDDATESCGYPFHEEERYTVFAHGTGRSLSTGLCSGNVRGDIDPARYGFATGEAPQGGLAFTGPEPWERPAAFAGAAVAVFGLGTLLVLARRPGHGRG